jgi:translation elongation factor EF-Tu-like GTPase
VAIEFLVENAGCVSCGRVVRGALTAIGAVEVVGIDEHADVAVIRLEPSRAVSAAEVDAILQAASAEAGHEYRVRPDSWTLGPAARSMTS